MLKLVRVQLKNTELHVSGHKTKVIQLLLFYISSVKHYDVDIYAGHNVYFDIDMIASEFHRNGIINPFSELRPTVHALCTMRKVKYSTKIKMIDRNGETYTKSPTLQELYEHTYPTHSIDVEKLHNSMNDVWLTLLYSCENDYYIKCDPYDDCKEVRNAVNKILNKNKL